MVDLPILKMDIFHSYLCLPEGKFQISVILLPLNDNFPKVVYQQLPTSWNINVGKDSIHGAFGIYPRLGRQAEARIADREEEEEEEDMAIEI